MKNQRILIPGFLWLVLSVFSSHSFANTYYFSASEGDDGRSPAQAQIAATPWRSLEKLNEIFDKLVAGDVVLLKRGDVFAGALRISASGTLLQPILLGAYGLGDKPIISGLVSLQNYSGRQ